MPPAVTRTVVLLLGALTGFAPLTIDMYLPALPVMGEDLGGTSSMVQLTVSSFFAGMAIGQLIYGPLSDAYGRKRPLYVGLVIYVIASLGCAMVPTIGGMIGLRFIEALGGCAGMIIARAVVRDLVSGQDAARLFSSMMLVMGVAPILAPLAGSYVLLWSGWRMIFLLLAVFGVACLIGCAAYLPETLPPSLRRPAGFQSALRSYGILLRERRFMGYSLASGIAMSTLFAYITASAQVFIGIYGMTPNAYAWLFGSNAAGLIAFSQLNRRLLRTRNLYQVLRGGLAAHVIAALAFLLVAVLGAPLPVLCVPLWLTLATLGVISPNGSAASLSGEARMAGAASSLMGIFPFVVGAFAGVCLGLLPQDTPISLAAVIAAASVAAWASHRCLVGKSDR
jgi:DHA1 family bicyclomycin/chloramphenicol resistance-like MFS transporter